MTHILFQLTHLPPLGVYGFVLLWLAAESAGLPLPDEAVLLTLGFLAHRGTVSLPPLILCAVAGSAIGAAISYQIGYALGRPVVARIASRVGISDARLTEAEVWVRRRGGIGVFLTRVIPFARNLASYAAGIASIPPRIFYPAMLLGALVWCTTVTSVGDALGAHYATILRLGPAGLLIGGGLLLVALIAWIAWTRLRGRRGDRLG
ncbi:MAG TPA: DedA family protein [Candidatus Nanopelagicaceae bacterium]|nr:DedA family protein [Candidatus Nanopelagicaceae bacterium]